MKHDIHCHHFHFYLEAIPFREAVAVQESLESRQGVGRWRNREPHEGFFVTTDLSAKELEEVLRSEEKSKFDKYLTQVIRFGN